LIFLAKFNVFVSDSLWLTLITACTIGFGDFFPSTHCGRFAAVVAAVTGKPTLQASISHPKPSTVNRQLQALNTKPQA